MAYTPVSYTHLLQYVQTGVNPASVDENAPAAAGPAFCVYRHHNALAAELIRSLSDQFRIADGLSLIHI